MVEVSTLDPTMRFSSRVADYVRYRPGYPREILNWLEQECGLTQETVVADVGSGTGLLSRLFLDHGNLVLGVEPNAEMRAAGEKLLASWPRFQSVPGSAEATGLDAASVDLVVAGQAFHWFDPERTRREFARILRPNGWVALVWNERRVGDTPFLAAYEELLVRLSPEYKQVDHRNVDHAAIGRFFRHHEWRQAGFPNRQDFDWQGLEGRARSSSYFPLPGTLHYEEIYAELKLLFEKYQERGSVAFLYDTQIYSGRLVS